MAGAPSLLILALIDTRIKVSFDPIAAGGIGCVDFGIAVSAALGHCLHCIFFITCCNALFVRLIRCTCTGFAFIKKLLVA